MKIIRVNEETASIFDVQYGVALEERASSLTQGIGGPLPEGCGNGRPRH
jgi:hypothetical protein